MKFLSLILFSFFTLNNLFAQGPYAPAVGNIETTAIDKDSLVFEAWATTCNLQRGWQNIADTSLGKTNIEIAFLQLEHQWLTDW
jgi:hypothetical protein